MEHTCKVCGVTSKNAEFYAGVTSRCKECHKALVKKNRQEKADYYREYDAKRFQIDPRVKARHKRYQETEPGKASIAKSKRKWQLNSPEKRAAHCILNNAVRDGKVTKPSICVICGNGGRIHGHHEDYTKPLDVIWCCPQCHYNIHKRNHGTATTDN
jgi:hypothetical protein